jgi:sugar phosphate isomerase/epimerase
MNLKGKFPFRIGAPSYVIPADILSNVCHLSHKVDDIELVLFESDEISALPESSTILELRQIAAQEDLTYTIHLPLDIWLGDSPTSERQKSVCKCIRVIERTAPLAPSGFVLHCEKKNKDLKTEADEVRWRKNIEKSIEELLLSGIPPEMLCIETLDYPFQLIEPIITEKKLGICLDIGHVQRHGFPLEEYINRYLEKSHIIHLHGVKAGRDHCEISAIGQKNLATILRGLNTDRQLDRVVSLENFNAAEFEASLSEMEKYAL